jgi:hypothetical protein
MFKNNNYPQKYEDLDENGKKIVDFMKQRKEIFYTSILPEWESKIDYSIKDKK